jgi:hypothetical protein
MGSGPDDSQAGNPTATYWVNKFAYVPMPLEIAIITSVFSGLFGVLGVIANGLVMYLIIQIKKFHQLENLDILVVSLCFSDFLSSLIVQPVLITRILPRSRVSEFHSRLTHVSTHFTLVWGSLSLLFITFSRYLSVKFPFYYAHHISETKMYGCLVAIFSATVGMTLWVFFDGQTESATFPVIISVIFSLTIILQAMIFAIVYVQNRSIRRQVLSVQHNQEDITRQTNIQRGKINKTILYICAVYIATWLPQIIFRIYYFIDGDLTFYAQWLHLFNVVIQLHSCINPWLYALRTSRVKQVLNQILARIFRTD